MKRGKQDAKKPEYETRSWKDHITITPKKKKDKSERNNMKKSKIR